MTWSKLVSASRGGGRSRSPRTISTRPPRSFCATFWLASRCNRGCSSSPTIRQAGSRVARHRLAAPLPAPGIEHGLAGHGRHRGRQQHRIDRHPIAPRRLPQTHAAAEQVVQGRLQGRRVRNRRAHPSPARAGACAASYLVVLDHQPARDRADAALDPADVVVEQQAGDRLGGQDRLRPGQMDRDRCCAAVLAWRPHPILSAVGGPDLHCILSPDSKVRGAPPGRSRLDCRQSTTANNARAEQARAAAKAGRGRHGSRQPADRGPARQPDPSDSRSSPGIWSRPAASACGRC